MKNKVKQMTVAALIAALYVVLTVAQNMLLPGSTGAAIQFRVSEALCVLALFTPAAIPGLTVGCLIANVFAGLGAIDLLFGPMATLAAILAMWGLRKVKLFRLPLLSLAMPAVCNGVIIGAEIAWFFSDGWSMPYLFAVSAGQIALGEAAVLFLLGIPFTVIIERNKTLKQLLTE